MHTSDLQQAIRGHMPQLDALRGIAILWVILHNAALDGVGHAQGLLMAFVTGIGNSGWVGVQLFFVLSGFLITGILLEGRGATHQFRNFYARRTLRIFPLYYGFLLLAFVILPLTGLVAWDSTRLEQFLYWSYLTNWGLPFADHAVFPHLWSLAIEEQYQLLAQVALLRNFAPSGVEGIFNQTTIAVWAAMLVLVAIVPWRNGLDRLRPVFSSGFLRWIGKYSYAIYIFFVPAKMLWFGHFALVVVPDAPWRQLGVVVYNLVGITALAVAAAWVSWHVLEQPFLSLKRHFVLQPPGPVSSGRPGTVQLGQ